MPNKTPAYLIALMLAVAAAMPAQAASYLCVTKAMRGNKWICTEDPSVCSFVFRVDESGRKLTRNVYERNPLVAVVVDKWDDKFLIAHEDQPRIDSRYVEQFFYKIEFDSGNFLMANEYVTNSGRYLTEEELKMADRKRFSYYRPQLFSEKGRCRFRR